MIVVMVLDGLILGSWALMPIKTHLDLLAYKLRLFSPTGDTTKNIFKILLFFIIYLRIKSFVETLAEFILGMDRILMLGAGLPILSPFLLLLHFFFSCLLNRFYHQHMVLSFTFMFVNFESCMLDRL